MIRAIKRTLLWGAVVAATVVLSVGTLIMWPDPLFAYTFSDGKIIVASDRPIPPGGAERVLRDCESLLERSPLRPMSATYRLYVTNDDWRQRLFFNVVHREARTVTLHQLINDNEVRH